MKVGIIGSASEELSKEIYKKAEQVGRSLASYREVEVLNTGATTGTTKRAAESAKKNGLKTVGYSPASSLEEHKAFELPVEPYQELVFLSEYFKEEKLKEFSKSERFKLRIPILISKSDSVIAISGRIGTTTEILNALGSGKKIGILKDTGGVSPYVDKWLEILRGLKKTKSEVIFDEDPSQLVLRLFGSLPQQKAIPRL